LTWGETDDGIDLPRASSGDHQHQKGYYCEEGDEDQPVMTAEVKVDGEVPDDGITSRTPLAVAKKEVLHSQG
jgi:hypothetical protein